MFNKFIGKLKHIVVLVLRFLGLKPKIKKWPILSDKKVKELKKTVIIVDTKTTLEIVKETIKKQKRGAYLRFGDGDINLMYGINDTYQENNMLLSKEMTEAFSLNEGEIHKSLPIHSRQFGYENGMDSKKHLLPDDLAIKYISATYKFFLKSKIYSPVALHHLAIYDTPYCIEFLRFIKSRNPVFVGNKNLSPHLRERLFGKEIIETPGENAFSEIDRIESDLYTILNENKNNFRLIVIAMGCSGRVLQKRVITKGYNVYLFDFGSLLDAFNGKMTRSWIDESSLEILKNIPNEI